MVKAGELLFEIDPRPYKASLDAAQARKANAQANLKLATTEYERNYALFQRNAASAKDLEMWIAKKGSAVADISLTEAEIDRAKLDLEFSSIRAAITGRISRTQVTKGNLINTGGGDMLLTTIVAVEPMYVYFDVNERRCRNIKRWCAAARTGAPGAPKGTLAIPVEMGLVADTGFPHKGIVDFIDNKVDPNTGTIRVRARFDNPPGPDGRPTLVAGFFARVRVAVAEPYPAVLVSDRAILSDQSLKYVLVVNKDAKNLVERVDIAPADRPQDDGLQAVLAGLKGDEWVIVEGVNRTRPGATVVPRRCRCRRPTTGK